MLQEQWYYAGRSLVALYAQWILKADIQNKVTLPPGPKIMVANHPSTSDPAWVTVLVPEQVSILIKELLFQVPLFGRSLRMAGHIPVVQGNGKNTLLKASQMLASGRSVFVFPEGEISPREGGFQKAHSGVARLAMLTGAPVVPVGIGLDHKFLRTIPAKVHGTLDVGHWYLHGPYAMTVGRPMTFEGDPEDRFTVRNTLDLIMGQVGVLSQESFARVRATRPGRVGVGNMVGLGWQLFGRLFYQLSTI